MAALSWLRLSRRVPGLVRQRELVNLEALIDAEAGRQPTRNLFVLSWAIPAGIATFGVGSVFVAWLSGVTGLPLILGTLLTVVLSEGAWFMFYRLYRAISPSKRRLRELILKFSQRYASFGNIILGEQALSDPFAALLDEVAGIYLRHSSGEGSLSPEAPEKALKAIEGAMSKLMEVAVLKDKNAQNQALQWAQPMLEALRLLNQSLSEHAITSARDNMADPLARVLEARAELETSTSAIQELNQHLGVR